MCPRPLSTAYMEFKPSLCLSRLPEWPVWLSHIAAGQVRQEGGAVLCNCVTNPGQECSVTLVFIFVDASLVIQIADFHSVVCGWHSPF